MRILLIHRYFWPDTPPYAAMLLAIANKLVSDGHTVEILTSHPSYKVGVATTDTQSVENLNGVRIKRIRMVREDQQNIIFKLINIVYFPLRILFHLIKNPSINIAMCSTAPPVVTGLFTCIGSKLINAKFIYHCMDLHPEIGQLSGEFKNSILFTLLMKFDKWTCKQAESVIVLSEDMRQSLNQRSNHDNYKVSIINNFSLPTHKQTKDFHVPKHLMKNENTFRILFAGNIGRFQMLEAYIEAMDLLKDLPNIELVFLGEGASLSRLKKLAANKTDKQIKFLPHQSIEIAKQLITDADLGIVSLTTDVYKYAFPSKTMTYLEQGCPLLITVEPESELNKFVEKHTIGFSALPGDAESIASVIRQAVSQPELNEMRKNCLNTAQIYFSEPVTLNTWGKLFQQFSAS